MANISMLDGTGTPSFQWRRGTQNINNDPRSSLHNIEPIDEGYVISVVVIRDGYSGAVMGGPTNLVVGGVWAPRLDGRVVITGLPVVGEVLTANTDELYGTGNLYQWMRGSPPIPITRANDSTYTLQPTDYGHMISVFVSRIGYSNRIASELVGPIIAYEGPGVTGVMVYPATATVVRGDEMQFTATVEGNNNPPQTVTWSIDETDRHHETTIQNGLLIVAMDEERATLTIRATSTLYVDTSGIATVTITGQGSVTITIAFVNFLEIGMEYKVDQPISIQDTPPVITVANHAVYTYHEFVWRVGEKVVGNDRHLTLDANVHSNRIGVHFVTVEVKVERGDVPVWYSKRIEFTVDL